LLVQFVPASGISAPCRRCHVPLDYEEAAPPHAPIDAVVPQEAISLSAELAATIRARRHSLGLSQRQLAARLGVPRTYSSKLENLKYTPTLGNLEKIARALETSIPLLLNSGERSRLEAVNELMSDKFIRELQPFVAGLSEVQRRVIMTRIHNMSLRRTT
jgi:transcriptional regulator with XRE-family HTH domain